MNSYHSKFEIRGSPVQRDGAVDVGDEELRVVEPLGVGEGVREEAFCLKRWTRFLVKRNQRYEEKTPG